MKSIKTIFLNLFVFAIIISCNKQDWSQKIDIPLSASTNFEFGAELGNSRLDVNDAKFYITNVSISGRRLQGEDVQLSTAKIVEIDLLQDAVVESFEIPIGTYKELIINFELASNTYIDGEVTKINGNPQLKDIYLPLDLQSENFEIELVDQSTQEVLSISEAGKQLELKFDLQGTLNGVGNGAWNGLLNASQSQTSVDLNTIAGGNFLLNFKKQLLENASLKLK